MSKVYSERREPWQDDPLLFFPSIDDFKPQVLKNIRQLCDVDQLMSFVLKTPINFTDLEDEKKTTPITPKRSASRGRDSIATTQSSFLKAQQTISQLKDITITQPSLSNRNLNDIEIIDLIWLEIMGGEDTRYHLRAGPNITSSTAQQIDKQADFSFYETANKELLVNSLASGVPFALALRHFDHITTTKTELYLKVINHNPKNDTERYVNWQKCMKVLGLLPTFNIDLLFRGRDLASGKNPDLLFELLHEFHRATIGTGLVVTHTCLELALLDELYKASNTVPLNIRQLNQVYANGRLMASANLPQTAVLLPPQDSTGFAQGTPPQSATIRRSSSNPICRGPMSITEVKSMLTPSTPSKKDFHRSNIAYIMDLSEKTKEQRETEREQLLRRVSNTAYSLILSNPGTPRSKISASTYSTSVKRSASTPRSHKPLSEAAMKVVIKNIKPKDLPLAVRKNMSPSVLNRINQTGIVTYDGLLEAFNANHQQLHSFLTAFTDATRCSTPSLANESLNGTEDSFILGRSNQSSAFWTSAALEKEKLTQADISMLSKRCKKIVFDIISFDCFGASLINQEVSNKIGLHISFLESVAKDIDSRLFKEQISQLCTLLQSWIDLINTYNITKQNFFLKAKFMIESWLRENGFVPPSDISVESPINDPYRNGIGAIQVFNLVYNKDAFFRELQMRLTLTDDLYACYSTVSRIAVKQPSESFKLRSAALNISLSTGVSEDADALTLRNSKGPQGSVRDLFNHKNGLLYPKYQSPTNINDCIRNNTILLRKITYLESLPSSLVPNAEALVQGDFVSLYSVLLLLYLFDALEKIFMCKATPDNKVTSMVICESPYIKEFTLLLTELIDLFSPKTDHLLQAQRGPKPIPRTKDELSKLNGVCYSILLYTNGTGNLLDSSSRARSVQIPQALTPSRRALSISSLQRSTSLANNTEVTKSMRTDALDDLTENEKEVLSYFSSLEAAHSADYSERKEQYNKLTSAMSNWLYSLDCLPEPYMKIVDIAYFLRDGVALCKIVSTIFKLSLTPVDSNPKSANIQLANIKRALKFVRENYQYRSVPIPFIDAFEDTAIGIQRAEVGPLLILMRELYRIFAILRRETGVGGRARVSVGMSPSGVAYKLRANRKSPSPTGSRSSSPSVAQRGFYSKELGQLNSKLIKLAYAIDDIEKYADSQPQQIEESKYVSDCLIRAPEEMHVWKIPSTSYPLVNAQSSTIPLPFSVQGSDFVPFLHSSIKTIDAQHAKSS